MTPIGQMQGPGEANHMNRSKRLRQGTGEQNKMRSSNYERMRQANESGQPHVPAMIVK